MASMPSGVGKTDAEIWEMFKAAHLSPQNPESELRRIHLKWVNIRAEADLAYRRHPGKKK